MKILIILIDNSPKRLFRTNVSKQTMLQIFQLDIKWLKIQLAGNRPVGYLQSAAMELNSEQPRTNPQSEVAG